MRLLLPAHSTSHEVLYVAGGSASIERRRDASETAEVEAGDAVVIPAGVGYLKVGSSEDFTHRLGGRAPKAI